MFDSLQSVSVPAPTAAPSDAVSVTPHFPIDRIGTWLSSLIQSSLDGVIVIDTCGRMMMINREIERMFARPSLKLLEQPFETLVPKRLRAETRAQLAHFAAAKMNGRRLRIKLDLQGLRADGDEFTVSASISRISIRGEVYLTLVLKELADRARGDMPATPSKLRKMVLSSQLANEIEKRRFSRELYDELGQRLSVLKLDLDWLEHSNPANARIPDRIAQMQELLDNIIERTKAIASTLRPTMLDDLGLGPAVDWMAGAFSKKTGIACRVINDSTVGRPGGHIESAIFRLLQESLSNIERHAQASNVVIHLWHTEHQFHVTIQDDGIGLSDKTRAKPDCHGLDAMWERVYALGGRLDIQNNSTRGVTIRASIPFQA
ncbi:MAG: sensor histidine kinase [Burkholderiales bacterium]|nr:sensor histidine kinase [Burkholderiales bacterium]